MSKEIKKSAEKEEEKSEEPPAFLPTLNIIEPNDLNHPFTKQQISQFNEYSHYTVDLNKEFSTEMEQWKYLIQTKLGTPFPQPIQDSLERYRNVLYNYYLTETRITAYAPPPMVVGPANYPVRRLAKARQRNQKNREILEQAKEKLKHTIDAYYGSLVHQRAIATSVAKGDPQLAFEQSVKRGDVVEARFTANNQRFVFPAKVVSIAKSSIRVATLSDGVPYKSEQAGREFVLPFGFAKTKSQNNGVFPISA